MTIKSQSPDHEGILKLLLLADDRHQTTMLYDLIDNLIDSLGPNHEDLFRLIKTIREKDRTIKAKVYYIENQIDS